MRISARKIGLASAVVMAIFANTILTPCFGSNGVVSQVAVSTADAQVRFSPGLRDVLKMLDAKVDSEVVKAFIKNSQIAFNPSAAEIIALKQRGVPDDIITALIQRGTEVRAQMAQGNAAYPNTAAPAYPNTVSPAYPYDYATAPYTPASYSYPYDYADYGYGYPYYGYSGYPYNYWWYNYGYPFGFYSPFFFGFYGHHRFGDFDRDRDRFHGGFDRFHGDRSFAFRGPSGLANRGGPWSPTVGLAHRPFANQSGFGGRSFAFSGARPSGFAAHVGGFAGRPSGFGGHVGGGFSGRVGGGFGGGGHIGGGHGGGGHR